MMMTCCLFGGAPKNRTRLQQEISQKALIILGVICSIVLTSSVGGGQTALKPMTVGDLQQVGRVGDAQLSPNGKWIAYTVGLTDQGANKVLTQIYLLAISGGEVRQLTTGARSALYPRWSADSKHLAFVSSGQVWLMDPHSAERKQLTRISTGAYGPALWGPDDKFIAFTSEVYPDCTTDECNAERDELAENNKVKAHVAANRLLFRHWDEWRDSKRTHVFVVPTDGGPARDVTPGDFDSPPYAAATGNDIAFAPDGQEIAFVRNPDKEEATSTNSDIFTEPVAGGNAKNITADNHGYDVGPIYTRNGKYIIYRSQATAGFEADRWRLMAYNRATGISSEILKNFDLQVEETALSPDGNYIFFTAGERGKCPIYRVPVSGGEAQKLLPDVCATSLQPTPDGKSLIFVSSSMVMPAEIYRLDFRTHNVIALTKTNKDLMARFGLRKAEEIEWVGAFGRKIHGFIVKPANFDASNKYPLLVLIHGGPQGAWNDNWGYRWNPQVFANNGYVVFCPNPRGSTGYGQQFVNEVSGDWGGRAYTDIMNGVALLLDRGLGDKQNVGAAGASYGGYMVNWIEGHNTDTRFQFKALVSHDGMFNLISLYGATDELWYPEWEFKGTPWDNPEMYARWSPNTFVRNFKTPLLVIHGELDYRVPIDQSLQLFTALRKMGVESKLIIYPDEGHWVLKPQNSAFWYAAVIDWFDQHLKAKTDLAPRSAGPSELTREQYMNRVLNQQDENEQSNH